jgi:hypothetical protein
MLLSMKLAESSKCQNIDKGPQLLQGGWSGKDMVGYVQRSWGIHIDMVMNGYLTDVIPLESGKTLTMPRYVSNSEIFCKLAGEAYTILFDQLSYTQCYVVKTTAKVKLLPLKGLLSQTNIEQLVQSGNKLPVAI